MVEHNMSVVADLSDTITVLARGEVLAEGPYATVSRDPAVVEAYVGTGHAEALLKVADLQAWYGESHILHGWLEIGRGELVTLLAATAPARPRP